MRISRGNLLASAFKVFELYGSNSSVLEVEYFEEVGTGLGPTLEFYSLVSRSLLAGISSSGATAALADPTRTAVSTSSALSVYSQLPCSWRAPKPRKVPLPRRLQRVATLPEQRRSGCRHSASWANFAKALLDSRIIDCNFSPVFMRAVLNQHVAPTLATLSAVDPTLARSLSSMRQMPAEEIESLGLDFTLPGYESIELHAGGRDDTVTSANLERYISEVLDMTLHKGFARPFALSAPASARSSPSRPCRASRR